MKPRAATIPVFMLTAMLASAGSASAERLVTSLSSHRVMITSNFTGAELVLFGSVERDAATVPRRGGYDLVATVTGPRQTLVTRRKDRVFGIWVNVESRAFVEVPSYLAIFSNKPFDAIANANMLRQNRVGFANTMLTQQIGPDLADTNSEDSLRMAFIRLRQASKLYIEQPNGVTFLTPALYRASILLPAETPVGAYEVDVKLFADGAMIARTASALEVVKVGFEQFVAASARDYGFLYGLVTMAMALMTGWLASVAFRRD